MSCSFFVLLVNQIHLWVSVSNENSFNTSKKSSIIEESECGRRRRNGQWVKPVKLYGHAIYLQVIDKIND